jgi:DNA-directed RNA polymerase specialized sigma24 family protein
MLRVSQPDPPMPPPPQQIRDRFLEHLWAGGWRRLRAWRAEREQGIHAARVAAETEELDGQPTDHPDHLPEIALEARQLRECLEQGMALVTPNQQQLLRLRHVETLRHQDIALHLGRALGTIASNLADAERALRRRLIGQCAELIEGLLGTQRRRR